MRLNYLLIAVCVCLCGCSNNVRTKQDILNYALKIKEAHQDNSPKNPTENKSQFEETAPQLNKLPAFEELTYKARYLGMTVGSMTASIKGIEKINGRDAYKFELTAKTEGVFAKMFKVEDRYVSYMDVEKLYVVRSEEYRHEGNYKKSSIVDFDQVNHKAYYRHLTDGTKKTIDIPPDVQDALTANYYFRMIPWGLGDTVNFKIYMSEKVYDLIGLIKSKTKMTSRPFGKQEAYAFEPYALLNGMEVKEGNAIGYFAASESRPPLRGIVKTPVFGAASVTLYHANYDIP